MSITTSGPTRPSPVSGRARPLAFGAAALLALTGCGGQASGEDDQVELRFTWWGGDARHQYTQEIIDAFEQAHPHITVQAEFGGWTEYWDQLATQTAARTAPDVMQMDLMYIREYIENGVLLELDDVDTSAISEDLLATGTLDGTLYGAPVGSAANTLVANTDVFAEAGVDLPDDTSWTWEDMGTLTEEISAATDSHGLARPFGDFGFEIWLRQHGGKDLLTEDGEAAVTADDARPYFEMLGELQDSGALASASEVSEDRAAAHEQTAIATGGAALDSWWDTNIVALTAGAEDLELVPLMMPSQTGDAADAEHYYKASMFWSASAGTDHPEEAQLFIDFLLNSQEAGELALIDRGIPANDEIRELIRDDLDEVETRVVEYSEGLEDVVSAAPPLPPEGFGAVQEIIWRYEEEFLFGRADAEQAAERMVAEIEDAIS